MSIFIGAFALGFLGSFHCVGMCGPIALALPLNRRSLYTKAGSALLYSLGRITTYAAVGLLFGLLGYGLVISGIQQIVSVVIGSLIILAVLVQVLFSKKLFLSPVVYTWISRLKSSLGSLFKKKGYGSLYLIGLLNGLLPCGLVYLGIAGAIATGGGAGGSMFMTLFGIGTLPSMFLLSMSAHMISIGVRNRIRKAMPVFVVCMGLMLVLRGLNLGIPYVSPEMSSQEPVCHKCCNK